MRRGPIFALLGVGAAALYLMNKNVEPSLSAKASFAVELYAIVKAVTAPLGWSAGVVTTIVAWAAMESGWGTSKLAIDGNNLFGIKAGPTWKAEGKAFDSYVTHEHQGQPGYPPEGETITATFRHYGSWTESVQDVLKLIRITNIYKPAYDALNRGDIQGFFQAINASGYSTARNYSGRILGALNTIKGLA